MATRSRRDGRRQRIARAAVVTALCCGSPLGVGWADEAAATTTPAVRPAAALDWQPCPGALGAPLQCARLSVPLHHDALDDRTVELALYRLRALDPAVRQGTLVANPGGPGVATRAFLGAWGAALPVSVRAAYDLVTFDPRGIGDSEGLACGATDDLVAGLDGDPIGAQVDFAATLAAECTGEDAALLSTMTTTTVARDLDLVRAALGEERLDYVGYSYGSLLGSVYAELFPQRVGRFVLDGIVDPAADYEEWVSRQVVGFESSLQSFFAWCDAWQRCEPGVTAQQLWEHLAWRARQEPLPTAAGGVVTEHMFQTATIALTYAGERAHPVLADALREAFRGDAGRLAAIYEQFVGAAGGYYAYVCGDDADRIDPAGALDRTWRLMSEAPHLYWALREVVTCGAFPAATAPLPEVELAPGEVPAMLLIGNTGDPATPYANAEALQRRIGGSTLLTFAGGGHTISFQGVPCIDIAVASFLLAGTLPPAGATCGTDTGPPRP